VADAAIGSDSGEPNRPDASDAGSSMAIVVWVDDSGDFRVEVSGGGSLATVTNVAWSARVVASGCSYTSETKNSFFTDNVADIEGSDFVLQLAGRGSGFEGTVSGHFVSGDTLDLIVDGSDNTTSACSPYESVSVPIDSRAELHPAN
jgi:hypothetical protein